MSVLLNARESVPLRKWIQDDAKQNTLDQQTKGPDHFIQLKKLSVLRKSTVAYGIIELLNHARIAFACQQSSATSRTDFAKEFSIDNFNVHLSRRQDQTTERRNVVGVSMISPRFMAQLSEPSFISNIADENIQHRMGRYLEVDITPPLPSNITHDGAGQAFDKNDCRVLGMMLYELYSGMHPIPAKPIDNTQGISCPPEDSNFGNSCSESKREKSTGRYGKKKASRSLQERGFPSSVSLLVHSLIDTQELYTSLDAVKSDIHLLLSDPDCFLYDLEDSLASQGGSSMHQLRIKEGKLYGRENEVCLITDAFCRVSTGKNEAIFIGGYSGSGKSAVSKKISLFIFITSLSKMGIAQTFIARFISLSRA